MQRLGWILAGVLAAVSVGAQPALPRYVQAVVEWEGDDALSRLLSHPIPWEDGRWQGRSAWEGPLTADEAAQLQKEGFRVTIQIEDLAQYYIDRNAGVAAEAVGTEGCSDPFYGVPLPDPAGFSLGSMGGFFTLEEIYAHLDSMRARFPHLISAKQPIDTFTTHEGRPIYYVKISDNPDADEDEPAILFTALHHAREPAGASQLIYFMYTLLENYATHPAIQWLVDHTEIYIIPCVNPDGYYFNQITYPQGGGLWRKNRRRNADGSYGVDLNRNYGFHWGYDNQGSSPVPSSQVYRGPAPFSEPETRAVRFLCMQDSFRIALNYHTYSNLLIYPWGFAPDSLTPDSAYYRALAAELVKHNRYFAGTGDQTVGYIVNGDSDDWMYGDSSKPKIFAMTPEVGSFAQGFWPKSSDILPLCRQTRWMNLAALAAVHNYMGLRHQPPSLLTASSGTLTYDVTPLGFDSGTATLTVQSLSPEWVIDSTPRTYSGPLAQPITDSVSYTVIAPPAPGTVLRYVIRRAFGPYEFTDTFAVTWGPFVVQFADSFAGMMPHWTTTGWALSSTVFHSPPYSITESPGGNYANNTYAVLLLDTVFYYPANSALYLSFWARWDLEPNYDRVRLQIQPLHQNEWTDLCAPHMTRSQWTGYTGRQDEWVHEVLDLSDWTGRPFRLRFVFWSDQNVTADGFYLDDIALLTHPPIPSGIASRPSDALQAFSTSGEIRIRKPREPGRLTLYTLQGKRIAHLDADGSPTLTWPIHLPPGGYLLTFSGSGNFATCVFGHVK